MIFFFFCEVIYWLLTAEGDLPIFFSFLFLLAGFEGAYYGGLLVIGDNAEMGETILGENKTVFASFWSSEFIMSKLLRVLGDMPF